jgi:hypothetical protein
LRPRFKGAGVSRSALLGRDGGLSSGTAGLIGFAGSGIPFPGGSPSLPLVATSTAAAATSASHPTFLQRTRASQSTPHEGGLRPPFAPVAAIFRC